MDLFNCSVQFSSVYIHLLFFHIPVRIKRGFAKWKSLRCEGIKINLSTPIKLWQFFFCLPLGFLSVVGPTERWCCLRHLARPFYVALRRPIRNKLWIRPLGYGTQFYDKFISVRKRFIRIQPRAVKFVPKRLKDKNFTLP